MCCDSPDYSGMNQAAVMSAEVGNRALDWYMERDKAAEPLRQRAADLAERVSLAQIDGMNNATRLANEAETQNKPFRAAETTMLRDAMDFDTEGKREELAGQAMGDVNQSFSAARGTMARDLARTGVNPSDGQAHATSTQLALGQALAGSHAKNKARTDATTMGHARKMDALSLARGLPAQQATQAQLALTSGNAAVDTAQAPVTLAHQSTQVAGQGFTTAMQGHGQSGNIYGNIARTQASEGDGMLSGLANLGMAGKYMLSDENEKEGVKPVDGEIALNAVRQIPVKGWRYKKGSTAADGGQEHIGPMAQDVNAALGDEAAPGGKVIDPVTLQGVTLAAVKTLDKKVDAIALKAVRA